MTSWRGVTRCLDKPANADIDFDPIATNNATAAVPHRLFNVGNSQPVELLHFIEILERLSLRKSIKQFIPMANADLVATYADTSALEAWIGFTTNTSLVQVLDLLIDWIKIIITSRMPVQLD